MNPDKDKYGKPRKISAMPDWEDAWFEKLHEMVKEVAEESSRKPNIASRISDGTLLLETYINIPEDVPKCYHVVTGANGSLRIGSPYQNTPAMNVCIIDKLEISYKQTSSDTESSEIYFVFEDDNDVLLAVIKSDELIEANE